MGRSATESVLAMRLGLQQSWPAVSPTWRLRDDDDHVERSSYMLEVGTRAQLRAAGRFETNETRRADRR
jgi:hypothetical protein